MGIFSKILLKTRADLGFKSGLSFYKHLSERDGVSINYPHYKKIEMGTTPPQAEFVRRLAKALPEHAESLIRGFCADQFPEYLNLFSVPTESPPPPKKESSLLYSSDELTLKQVSVIARSETHYAFFLMITLARSPIRLEEIQVTLKSIQPKILEDFINAKLIHEEGGNYQARSIERVFPKAESIELKKLYSQLDLWDMTVHEKFNMNDVVKKTMFRRVSPRYIPLLAKQAEVLIEQLRTSDDSDFSKNSEVLALTLSIKQAKLPG